MTTVLGDRQIDLVAALSHRALPRLELKARARSDYCRRLRLIVPLLRESEFAGRVGDTVAREDLSVRLLATSGFVLTRFAGVESIVDARPSVRHPDDRSHKEASCWEQLTMEFP